MTNNDPIGQKPQNRCRQVFHVFIATSGATGDAPTVAKSFVTPFLGSKKNLAIEQFAIENGPVIVYLIPLKPGVFP